MLHLEPSPAEPDVTEALRAALKVVEHWLDNDLVYPPEDCGESFYRVQEVVKAAIALAGAAQ